MCLRKKKLLKGGVVEINMHTTRELEGKEKEIPYQNRFNRNLRAICVSVFIYFQAAERKVKKKKKTSVEFCFGLSMYADIDFKFNVSLFLLFCPWSL